MRPLQEEREFEEGTHQKSTSSFEKWKPKDRSIELSKLFTNTQIYKYKNHITIGGMQASTEEVGEKCHLSLQTV